MKKLTLFVAGLMIAGSSFAAPCDKDKTACKSGKASCSKETKVACKEGKSSCCQKGATASKTSGTAKSSETAKK